VTAAAAAAAPVHLRPGDDLRDRLPAAGVAGRYFCLSDPVCVGPARDGDGLIGWIGRRARFVALHAGVDAGEARARLGREYAALLALDRQDDPVWLWFEHDLWDQAALLRVLSLLAPRPALRGRLWPVPADGARSFPELPDAELAGLRPAAPLTDAQAEEAVAAWEAFAAEDPRGLDALAQRALALPFLAAALRRHLQDLPWTTDGLALTERLVLRAVAGGAADPAAVHRALRAADPVFHVTDLIVAEVVRRLQQTPLRPLAAARPGAPLRPTARGEALLVGGARHRPFPRAHGGTTVRPDPDWLWDPDRDGVVPG
jgi:hypothetical protein